MASVSSWYKEGVASLSAWYNGGVASVSAWYNGGVASVSAWYQEGGVASATKKAAWSLPVEAKEAVSPVCPEEGGVASVSCFD